MGSSASIHPIAEGSVTRVRKMDNPLFDEPRFSAPLHLQMLRDKVKDHLYFILNTPIDDIDVLVEMSIIHLETNIMRVLIKDIHSNYRTLLNTSLHYMHEIDIYHSEIAQYIRENRGNTIRE